MERDSTASIRFLGSLHTFRKARVLPTSIEVPVPPEGRPAIEIVTEMGLPPEKVGHVILNGSARDLRHPVRPGDRLAILPPWVTGPVKEPAEKAYLGGAEKSSQ